MLTASYGRVAAPEKHDDIGRWGTYGDVMPSTGSRVVSIAYAFVGLAYWTSSLVKLYAEVRGGVRSWVSAQVVARARARACVCESFLRM